LTGGRGVKITTSDFDALDDHVTLARVDGE
jgi:hypothetical protein